MTEYKISTTQKKSVEERQIWVKGDKTIVRIIGYRWGSVHLEVEDGEELGFDAENEDGVDVYATGHVFDLDSLDDCWYTDVEYPDGMSEEEQERMDKLWDQDWYDGWEKEGWELLDTECWFYGPLEIEKIEK